MNKCVKIKRWATEISLVILGGGMSACATGGSGTHWKKEVLLHDGSTLIVERSFSRGGRHEIGQGSPIKSQDLETGQRSLKGKHTEPITFGI